jgi:hypothetical protein
MKGFYFLCENNKVPGSRQQSLIAWRVGFLL